MQEVLEKDHMGLVYRVAQELANTDEMCIRAFGRDVAEYLGEGYLALQIAKKGFKPELGFQFSTYATQVIRDRIIQAARKCSLIKVGFQARVAASRILQGMENLPENENRVKDALRVMNIVPITECNESGKEDDLSWEASEELYARLEQLDERTRMVIVLRYGLDGKEPLTLEEVGKRLKPSLTRERVRQIEKEGLNDLRITVNL